MHVIHKYLTMAIFIATFSVGCGEKTQSIYSSDNIDKIKRNEHLSDAPFAALLDKEIEKFDLKFYKHRKQQQLLSHENFQPYILKFQTPIVVCARDRFLRGTQQYLYNEEWKNDFLATLLSSNNFGKGYYTIESFDFTFTPYSASKFYEISYESCSQEYYQIVDREISRPVYGDLGYDIDQSVKCTLSLNFDINRRTPECDLSEINEKTKKIIHVYKQLAYLVQYNKANLMFSRTPEISETTSKGISLSNSGVSIGIQSSETKRTPR